VFFVSVDVGWVAGEKGTILKTTDGGTSWEAQLGGDAEGSDDDIALLHFVDERHGWASQRRKLLHTRDGETWEEIGTLPDGASDLAFTSPQVGFVAAKERENAYTANAIYRTTDGGRSWQQAFVCTANIPMGGLHQEIGCTIRQLHFPSPRVGYAAARNHCAGAMSCSGPPLIVKTEDGGATWQASVGPGAVDSDVVTSLFFLDERTGFVRLDSEKLHMTADGGATWKGLVAAAGSEMHFADPSVGWSLSPTSSSVKVAYSTNGGGRWMSRTFVFPSSVRAFSLPRRDRAYIVGAEGMVFRYRVVPASHTPGPNDIAAPAMPAFGSELDDQIERLEQVVTDLGTAIGGAAPAAGAEAATTTAAAAGDVAPTGGDSTAAPPAAADAPLPAPSAYTAQCCKQPFSKLEVVLGALGQTLPQFIGQYRNLNLLVAGIRMSADLPAQLRAVRAGLRAFRQAPDQASAQSALAQVSAALQTLKQTTAVAYQERLPATP
jgi:hypothetical protein